jgi:tetratricopeptide (TPR) repeat protein
MSAEDFKIQILIQRGNYKEAQSMIRARLAQEPNDTDLHLMLAQALFHLDRPKEAEASARTAIGLDPESGYSHEVLAQILAASSNSKGAEEAVREAMSLDGDSASLRAILARIASDRGKYEKCLEHAQCGLEIDPDNETCRFYRGIALSRLGHHEEADQVALGLLGDDPDESTNHSVRGWILLETNAIENAKMHFQEALRLDPDNEDARCGLARCLQQGNPFLGWFLRAIIAVDRISFTKMLFAVVLVGIVLPRFLRSEDMPEAVNVAGEILRIGVLSFFFLAVVVAPLFSSLLFLSRGGRNALGSYELKAVKWSIAPLLVGVVLLVLWIAGGGKSTPLAALGFLCTSTLLYEATAQRHPWVRQRMLIVAGAASLCAIWFLLGPLWLLMPLVEDLVSILKANRQNPDSNILKEDMKRQVAEMLQVRNYYFTYPSLALYIFTSYSDGFIGWLTRKAPDDAD